MENMGRLADFDRWWRAHAVLAACTVALPFTAVETIQASEREHPVIDAQSAPLHREAPVFSYRQFTSRLPQLTSVLEDTDQADHPASGTAAEPVLQESTDPAGRRQAGLMGRFGQTLDADSARDGLAAATSEQAEPSGEDPKTTAAVAVDRPAPDHGAQAAQGRWVGTGRASWYQHPGRTASGETYNPNTMTAAHHSLPFGTKIKVVNKKNGRSVVVRITDRTNERTKAKRDYAIDLSRASARQLGIEGIGLVALYKVD